MQGHRQHRSHTIEASPTNALFWFGSTWGCGGAAVAAAAGATGGCPLGTTCPAGAGAFGTGPFPLNVAALAGVIGVAGVGGSGSADVSATGVAAALRFVADFFWAAV